MVYGGLFLCWLRPYSLPYLWYKSNYQENNPYKMKLILVKSITYELECICPHCYNSHQKFLSSQIWCYDLFLFSVLGEHMHSKFHAYHKKMLFSRYKLVLHLKMMHFYWAQFLSALDGLMWVKFEFDWICL